MPAAPEATLALLQAQARWGGDVVVAGLFRPGPDPQARTALTKAVTRRTNRRRGQLPARLLLAVDTQGRALVCPYVADPQGGHPEGDDLYAAPFEELGAVATGPLSLVALLDDAHAVVLESVWLDRDAATITALLTGEPLPDSLDGEGAASGGGGEDEEDEEDEESPYAEALLAQAEAAQARADALRALALAAKAEEAEAAGAPVRPPGAAPGRPRPPRPPPPVSGTDPSAGP